MRNADSRTKLTQIRALVDQLDGFLADLRDKLPSSHGASVELDQCTVIHKLILEELNDYSKAFAEIVPRLGS